MLLVYIDESGINYSKDIKKYWTDGPYAIWSSILVSEKKYFDIERSFQDVVKTILGKNPRKQEIHACDIWESRKESPEKDKRVREYFEELIQLTAKLHVQVVLGIQQKNPKFSVRNKHGKELELNKARYSFLSILEHQLAEMDESGILISDSETEKEKLKNQVFKRTEWRYSPPGTKFSDLKPKYIFEYRSNFIIDQLHYVDSADSLLVQFSDHICFVLRRVFEHLYLLNFPKNDGSRPIAVEKMVPITQGTFHLFLELCNVKYACYKENNKDVTLGTLCNLPNVNYPFTGLTSSSRFTTLSSLAHNSSKQILEDFTPYG